MKVKKTPRNAPGGTPATQTLSQAGVAFTIHSFDTEPSGARSPNANLGFGLAAASALGVEHDRVFKTLVISLQGGQHDMAVAVVPVTRQVSLKGLANTLGAKRAELLDPTTAERITGYVIGGISPLGQRRQLPTIIDESALGWDTIFVSAGRRGSDIEVGPTDLIRVLQATTADISDSSWK